MITITAAKLRKMKACKDQVALFIATFGKGAEVENTLDNLNKANEAGLDLGWLALRLAPAVYEATRGPAHAAYGAIKGPAWAAYKAIQGSALAAYEAIRDPAYAEYKAIQGPAWAAYEARMRQAAIEALAAL
jgi:hypothetical protein